MSKFSLRQFVLLLVFTLGVFAIGYCAGSVRQTPTHHGPTR